MENIKWFNKEIRSFVWWVNHPRTSLPLAIFSSRWLCLLSCPKLNQQGCYIWRLHSQRDIIDQACIEAWVVSRERRWWFGQDGANVRPESSCLLICKDKPLEIQWHRGLTAQIMRELAQVRWVGIIMLTCSFHFSHCRYLLANAYHLALLSNSTCQAHSLLEDCLR